MDQEINDNVNQQKGKKRVFIRKPAEFLCSCINAFLDNDFLATRLHSAWL